MSAPDPSPGPDLSPREARDKKSVRRVPRLQLLALVALLIVVVFAFAQKVAAQGAPKNTGATAPRGGAKALVPKVEGKAEGATAEAKPEAGAGAPAEQKPAEEKAEEKKEDEEEGEGLADHLKNAVVGPNGGVPTQRKGDYRSPFANPRHGQATARVGFLLETIDDYDIKKGTFSAHFFVSLTSEKPMPEVDLQATNGKLEEKELLANFPTFKMWKMAGTFTESPDLHAYPFDTQELTIELEDDSNGADSLRLKPDVDHTFLDAGFEVAGWDVAFLRARVLNHYYPDRFENDDLYYSRYKFSLGIKRFATSAVFTVFVPALVIVLISLSGLWFPRDELEVRSNATTPMLAAAVLFHFALMQELPATAYLSRADKLMMAAYACLGLHMLSSWIWFVFDEKHTERLFRLAKWVCAPATILFMALGILL